MQCEQLNERLADYWAGTLTEAERARVEAHVATCDACQREAAELGETWRALGALPDEPPSASLAHRFNAMLDAWHEGERATGSVRDAASRFGARQASMSTPDADRDTRSGGAADADRRGADVRQGPWKPRLWQQPAWLAAAAALLVAAGLVGGFSAGRGWPTSEARDQVVELRGELRSMRETLMIALLTQDSAVDRLRGVGWSDQLDRPSDVVLTKLLDTLDHDPSVNVRIAAIDALRRFASEERVRTGLVDALRQQPEPAVQIALIDTMVDLRERRSADVLRTIAADEKKNEQVRKRALRGLQQLS